MLDSAVADSQ